VLDHSLLACDYAAKLEAPLPVRLAALYHDIGKPPTRRMEPQPSPQDEDSPLDESGVWTFYQHERISASMARNIGRRLRYPNAVIDRAVHLIEEHMFHYDDTWGDAAVRRLIIRVGEECLDDLYTLRRCDAFATAGVEPAPGFLAPLVSRVDAVLAQSRALSLKDLAVSGRDLMAIGVAPGKRLGIILGELLEAVVEDPEQNTRETLLEIAKRLWSITQP
jgi:putative nucleotidyltransferase with HDIG domain